MGEFSSQINADKSYFVFAIFLFYFEHSAPTKAVFFFEFKSKSEAFVLPYFFFQTNRYLEGLPNRIVSTISELVFFKFDFLNRSPGGLGSSVLYRG